MWGPRAENPWLQLVFDAVGPDRPAGPAAGDARTVLASEAGPLAGLLTDAGFADVRIEEVAVSSRAPSFEWW